ncbi:alpha/beta hydrolase [Hymenobacter sp. BT18]|uniref:alpha/beta hydrolase n=1 Tax=Hymenobacter sp. BT18 TaxID=2835648 RepID=UPI00143EC380|nr:alpha/beta hydrolase-fold protein [Hymenobacter sp. BT18]QIX60305.1 alpha/beta hydrolase [Hymenobacter sp. BT18]
MHHLLFRSPLILLLLSVIGSLAAYAQAPAAPLAIGQTFTLESATLGETRRINVYLPAAYTDSATSRLPVLYMPDGGMAEDFLHVAGLVQVGTGNGTMRPFILVGIENTARRRDMTGPTTNAEDLKIAPRVGGSAAFRKFIRTELMPAIRQRYRTTQETAIVGESLAGLFVVETCLLEPDLFDTYLAFDPSVWWNNGSLAEQAGSRLSSYTGPAKTLYVAFSKDALGAPTTRRFTAGLKSARPALTWHYKAMPEETHATIYHPAALQAFRLVFKPGKTAATK